MVWLDFDRDGRQGAAEPGVPGITVQAVPTRATTRYGLFSLRAARTALSSPLTTLTDRDGAFSFDGLDAGAYRVVAATPAVLSVTKDSEGPSDGRADVDVPSGGHGRAWVGLVGDATLRAEVAAATGGPFSGEVVVRWFGVDGVDGTADDVMLPLVVVDGKVDAPGLPAGSYVIERVGSAKVTVPVAVLPGVITTVAVNVADETEPSLTPAAPTATAPTATAPTATAPTATAPTTTAPTARARTTRARTKPQPPRHNAPSPTSASVSPSSPADPSSDGTTTVGGKHDLPQSLAHTGAEPVIPAPGGLFVLAGGLLVAVARRLRRR